MKELPLLGVQRHTTLGSIASPVFRQKPEDNWSPREIGLFESAICNYGKNFNAIQKLVSKAGRLLIGLRSSWYADSSILLYQASKQNNEGSC